MGIRSIHGIKIKKNPVTAAVATTVPKFAIFDYLPTSAKENVRRMYIEYLVQDRLVKDRAFWEKNRKSATVSFWNHNVWLDSDAIPKFSSPIGGISFSYDKMALDVKSLSAIVLDMLKSGQLDDWDVKHSLSLRFFNENNIRLVLLQDNLGSFANPPKVKVLAYARKTADANPSSIKDFELAVGEWIMQLQREAYQKLRAELAVEAKAEDAQTWLHKHRIRRFDVATGMPQLTPQQRQENGMLLPYLVLPE